MKNELEKELAELREKGLARALRTRDQSSLINFSSNDYLGLSTHPEVVRLSKLALDLFGVGGTASRLLAGTVQPHVELESELATFLSKEAALVFSSGYHVNTGVIPALVSAGDVVFFDRLSHASIIDGVRLSGATFSSFDHNDPNDLKDRLRKYRTKGKRALVVTEGIFSMDGDKAPLLDVVGLAHAHDAWVYLDEAHSIGVIGPGGKGAAAEAGVLKDIDVHVGTLSKTLGSQGGFVAGSKLLVDYLITRCRSLAYTTALAPAMAAGALAALKLFPELEERRRELISESRRLKEALTGLGYKCGVSDSPIIPVLTGSVEATRQLSEYLLSQGFFVPSIRPPTVPAGEGRVRLSVSTPVVHQIDSLIYAFKGGRVGSAS